MTFSSLAFLDLPFSRSDCDGLAEAGYLGLGLPLVVRVLRRLLGGGGQYGEVRAVAMDLPLLAESRESRSRVGRSGEELPER